MSNYNPTEWGARNSTCVQVLEQAFRGQVHIKNSEYLLKYLWLIVDTVFFFFFGSYLSLQMYAEAILKILKNDCPARKY